MPSLRPGQARAAVQQSVLLVNSDPQRAISIVEQALTAAIHSDNRGAVLSLARHVAVLSQGQGDFEATAAYYETALRIAPHDPWLLFAYGYVLGALGRRNQAATLFARSLELATRSRDADLHEMVPRARARYNLGPER